jgi:hypothetical protein
MTPRTPEWLVERLHQGDLPPAEAAAVRARLAEEGGLDRLDALAGDDRAFAAAHPPGPAIAEIRRRSAARAGRPRPRRLILAAAPLAVAAAAVLVLRGGEDTRLKGTSAHLVVHRAAPAGPEALAPGARVRAGDVLQLSVVSGGRPHGVVVSADGRGIVTSHGPGAGPRAAPLSPDGAVPLEHAYRLDDAPGFERFFLVTGGAPFDRAEALDAARRLAASGDARTGAPPLPPGLAWSDFLLEKIP